MKPGTRYELNSIFGLLFSGSISLLLGTMFTLGEILKWLHKFEINDSREFQTEDLVFFGIGWPILFIAVHLLVREPHALKVTDSGMLQLEKIFGTCEIDPGQIRALTTGVRWLWEEGSDATFIRFTLEDGKATVSNFEGAEAFVRDLLLKYPSIRAADLDFSRHEA